MVEQLLEHLSLEIEVFGVTKLFSGADAAFGYNLISNPYPCTLDFGLRGYRADNTFLDFMVIIYMKADAAEITSVSFRN